MNDWLTADSTGVTLTVRVVPRSSRNQIVGAENGALKIKLAAPPVEGAANAALIELMADWLNVRKSAVTIVSGDKARRKVVRVSGVTAEQVKARLG
jgi:uncharacterized protein (TIGR00251 family)